MVGCNAMLPVALQCLIGCSQRLIPGPTMVATLSLASVGLRMLCGYFISKPAIASGHFHKAFCGVGCRLLGDPNKAFWWDRKHYFMVQRTWGCSPLVDCDPQFEKC